MKCAHSEIQLGHCENEADEGQSWCESCLRIYAKAVIEKQPANRQKFKDWLKVRYFKYL